MAEQAEQDQLETVRQLGCPLPRARTKSGRNLAQLRYSLGPGPIVRAEGMTSLREKGLMGEGRVIVAEIRADAAGSGSRAGQKLGTGYAEDMKGWPLWKELRIER